MKNENLVRTALKANAAFSILSGLTAFILNNRLQELFNTNLSFFILGAGLLLFATGVYRLAIAETLSPKKIQSIIIMDLIWVIGSILLLIPNFGFAPAGKWIIGIIAIFVADFAYFQHLGLKRLQTNELSN